MCKATQTIDRSHETISLPITCLRKLLLLLRQTDLAKMVSVILCTKLISKIKTAVKNKYIQVKVLRILC